LPVAALAGCLVLATLAGSALSASLEAGSVEPECASTGQVGTESQPKIKAHGDA
jgi:hypothetical protein